LKNQTKLVECFQFARENKKSHVVLELIIVKWNEKMKLLVFVCKGP
jgi:hypothetical protein